MAFDGSSTRRVGPVCRRTARYYFPCLHHDSTQWSLVGVLEAPCSLTAHETYRPLRSLSVPGRRYSRVACDGRTHRCTPVGASPGTDSRPMRAFPRVRAAAGGMTPASSMSCSRATRTPRTRPCRTFPTESTTWTGTTPEGCFCSQVRPCPPVSSENPFVRNEVAADEIFSVDPGRLGPAKPHC